MTTTTPPPPSPHRNPQLAGAVRPCPECGASFDVPESNPRKMFCTDPHRVAWNNRMTVRGRVLTPLVMAERITRSGYERDKSAGILARQQSRRLMDKWVKEDRAAGRMAADTYFAIRQRLGFHDHQDNPPSTKGTTP